MGECGLRAAQGLLRLHTAPQTPQGGAWSCREAALPPVVSAKLEGVEWEQCWAGLLDSEISLLGYPGLPSAWLVVAEKAPLAAMEGNYEGVGEILQKPDNVLPLSPEL